MVKQRLEGHFRDVIKNNINIYYLKLQVNPLAHQTMPGDFLLFTTHFNHLIECKECNQKFFTFSRLTQKKDLLDFEDKLPRNNSYVLISFWLGSRKKSLYYLIPIYNWVIFTQWWHKKSANIEDFKKNLNIYRVDLKDIEGCFK